MVVVYIWLHSQVLSNSLTIVLHKTKISMKKAGISRRNFLGKAATVGVAGVVVPSLITSCSREQKKVVEIPTFLDQAPDGPVLKAGVIGCGGRGTGAAINFLSAGPNLQIVALGDTFKDRVDSCREKILKEKNQEVPLDKCFVGFDAYQKVIDAGVDIIILATPPMFRPEHLAAAVAAKKHVFAEKPVCVDPVGARSVMATAEKAKGMGLTIVTGTQRRHQRNYVATWQQVQQGLMGDITGGNVYWNGGKLWHRDNNPEWTEMEWMIRDWVNWTWLSGDHIVEQHVHNLDVMNWFTGMHPVKAVGMGSRLRRVTGNQYDNFSVDFTFENGMHFHSMCRQINGMQTMSQRESREPRDRATALIQFLTLLEQKYGSMNTRLTKMANQPIARQLTHMSRSILTWSSQSGRISLSMSLKIPLFQQWWQSWVVFLPTLVKKQPGMK